MIKASKEILQRDIVDKVIDDYIIRNNLIGKVPLTVELKRKNDDGKGDK